jgi:DNA-binding beta-propeller fold protein YncE
MNKTRNVLQGLHATRSGLAVIVVCLSLLLSVTAAWAHGDTDGGISDSPLFFVDYRNLNGGSDGVLLLNLDPESEQFGEILQNFELGEGVTPHHLYYNRDQSRLYNTALGGEFLYELMLEHDRDGIPTIVEAKPLDVGANIVGEDMYFTEDGSRFYMTFMGGTGGDFDGTIGVFDAQTNALIESIAAPIGENPASAPFILYPHGISVNEELGHMVVTSTAHPDSVTGAGNTLTFIDLETHEPLANYLVAESPEDFSVPVEVLLLRDEYPAYALTTTIGGGDIWIAPYDEQTGGYGEFTQAVDGAAEGLGVALELYIGPGDNPASDDDQLLYVSFGVPGLVNVYSLDNLPELELVRTLPASAGAHHMAFFRTESGREVMVSQNNLLNFPNLNAGTLTIADIHTGELLATLDLPTEYGWLPESIESAVGNAHFLHH